MTAAEAVAASAKGIAWGVRAIVDQAIGEVMVAASKGRRSARFDISGRPNESVASAIGTLAELGYKVTIKRQPFGPFTTIVVEW